MNIKYEFANGETSEVEVSGEVAAFLAEATKRNTRRKWQSAGIRIRWMPSFTKDRNTAAAKPRKPDCNQLWTGDASTMRFPA